MKNNGFKFLMCVKTGDEDPLRAQEASAKLKLKFVPSGAGVVKDPSYSKFRFEKRELFYQFISKKKKRSYLQSSNNILYYLIIQLL